jgi:diguanylate cyclase (GGDEF)-like protein
MKQKFDKKAVITDSLTSVHNLRYLDKVLSWEVVRADRWQLPLTMLMLDIDSFKQVNDMHGHVAGNTVLKSLAAILCSSVRPQDFVFRSGGDEFCIVLPGADLNGGLLVRERILSRIETSDLLPGLTGKVIATIGVCEYEACLGQSRFMVRAKEALLRAKRGGSQRKAIGTEILTSENDNISHPVITEDAIARRAYALYLARGGQDGHDVEDWLQAERELRFR